MRIVVAPDSFKGSITSIQASDIIAQAIYKIIPTADVILKPMADGGEGTLDSLLSAANGKEVPIAVTGPLGEKINTKYIIVDEKAAIIECASIAGLMLIPEDKKNPDNTTSFGIGEVMKDALNKKCTAFIIGLGGSAVNDGGLGMLQALGMKAMDSEGTAIGAFGKHLHQVRTVDFSDVDTRISQVSIKVASDVDNPLCGEYGATYVYGPQKGATREQLEVYDHSMALYGQLIESAVHKSYMNHQGAGAAGGLGFALLALGADLVSGAKLIAEAIRVEEAMKDADLIITGEGQSDEQTLYGKAPGYIATLAEKHNIPVVLLSGSLSGNQDVLREKFSGCFSIINKPLSLQESMENADELLYEQAKQLIHFISKSK